MKTIKLDHQLAEQVRSGQKTATWRIYDDKDLHVNDEIELIDKVDAKDPGTWTVVGNAIIDVIVEKRLGDIGDADYDGHESFPSQAIMLQTYQHYYGPQVTLKTPVKMIHFSLLSKSNIEEPLAKVDSAPTPQLHEAKLYADGGSRGNPGPSASGYVIFDMSDAIVVEKGIYLGVTTNNQAEYQALKFGLEEAQRQRIQHIDVYMDSMLVINQMKGIFKVKNRDLWPIHDAIKTLAQGFKHITFTHVPRALNKEADRKVNEALDEHLKAKQ
jgi:ribonuclease HI